MSGDELAKVVYLLATAMPGHRPIESAEELVAAWSAVLGDLPAPAVEGAALWHLAESKWFPTPAELRERAIRLLDGIVPYESYAGLGGAGLQQRVRRFVAAGRSMELSA